MTGEEAIALVEQLLPGGRLTAFGRIDAAFGDRDFVCSCLPMDAY